MKKLLSIFSILTFSSLLVAQTGKVSDNLSMQSKILKMERKYAVYLPPDYETSQRSYPVLYLLHGAGDDQTGWVQFGEVLHIADEAINSGTATPMIIVMPDANTGKRGYVNDVKGEWRYEDFFFEEFMPYIEKTYRIKPDKHYRAIAGLSMGGEGTFIYALHHPELFSAACPLSAATGPKSMEELNNYRLWQGVEGISDSEKQKYFNNYSVLNLIDKMPEDQKKSVRWYIDCGDDDFLYEGNCLVHIEMRKKEIPHEFRIRDGVHNWTYWRASLPVVLEFISVSFHQ
ncbi:MAG TPA: alpha/beta hydrolase-fold protein [Bacteroidales bacterium]|nr:alpha/beta hydrolase-fold protein [Bacteroidales bacterium]HPT22196.1 alpha/beta hydrolase-fold protein [Bacteroidales bacterium]